MQIEKIRYINDILETRENVLGIIYIITNSKNGKKYIGQTLSHKLNAKKYRPFGARRRLNQHISDALCNTKKKQCSYLANAIRKYGKDSFDVEILEYCEIEDSNDKEIFYISKHNTIAPNGYNLCEGGKKGPTLYQQRIKLMKKTQEQFSEKKLQKYNGIKFDVENIEQYIHERHCDKYGGIYYALIINKIKSIFVAQHIPSHELKQQVYNFLEELKKRFAT